mmetsp:Transcript_44942/g.79108  ORF Transcript_44942/g.79108 Transcript_44942/m.79108 type:complete len:212 (+) Transcript_44942:41-676(+)
MPVHLHMWSPAIAPLAHALTSTAAPSCQLRCSLELRLHAVLQQRPHVLQICHERRLPLSAKLSGRRALLLLHLQTQLPRPLGHSAKHGCELEAVFKERESPKDIDAIARATHRHDQSANVSQVTHVICPNQRHNDVIVLLSLELVNCGDLGGLAEQRVPCAALSNDVTDQCLLPVVSGEDADLRRWVSTQPHVHEERHAIFSFTQILEEMR